MPARPPPPSEPVIYHVDAHDRLVEMNEAWSAFASENEGAHLLPPGIHGRSLWDFVSGPTTQEIYRELLARVRASGRPFRFRLRCDSPDLRRLLSMTLSAPRAPKVRFEVRTVEIQPRPAVPLLDPQVPRASRCLASCSWCKRISVPGEGWLEVEKAVWALGLFEQSVLPALSHGACPQCHRTMLRAIEDYGNSRRGTDPVLGPLVRA